MKFLLCFGTRPEAIKMAPVVHELKKRNISFKVCVTGQHKEMLDQVLEFFEIKPDFDLRLMQQDQSLNNLSARILIAVDEVLSEEKPDMVLVHGDTTTSSITALAAFHRNIKVAHIEAGLRTYNKNAPFPEEINRQLTARIADLHFPPTKKARKNLMSEGIPKEQIHVSGNTIVDALNWGIKKSNFFEDPQIEKIKKVLHPGKKLILVTGHRRENFGAGLFNLCESLLELVKREDVEIIFPVHLNPAVQNIVYSTLDKQRSIHLIDPVSYPVMLWLLVNCDLIISDSGGIQEEAACLRKSVIVTRDLSERMEGFECGFSFITGTSKTRITEEACRLIENPPDLSQKMNPYGDGFAAGRIVSTIKKLHAGS